MKEALDILKKNELKELRGYKKINLWVLISILSLTLIGLGHSIGGVKDLAQRMDNPFTNWVNLPIPSNKEDFDKTESILRTFNTREAQSRYLLDTIIGYKRGFLRIAGVNSKEKYYATVRTVSPGEDLVREILKNSSSTSLSEFAENSCWIILKKDFMETLGFDDPDRMPHKVEVKLSYDKVSALTLFVDVLHISDELPDKVDAVIPEHMYELFFSPLYTSNLIETGRMNRVDVLSNKDLERNNSELNKFFKQQDLEVESIYSEEVDFHREAKFLNEIYLASNLDLGQRLRLTEALSKRDKNEIWSYNHFTCLDDPYKSITTPSNLAFIFNDLRKVREVRDKIKADYGFEISINQVEDKENFARITLLTSILSILLFIISLTSIIIYLIKLLISHFDRIQVNLGTFKAFGLENKHLISSYLHILTRFFFQALLASLAIVVIYAFLAAGLGLKFSLLHWSLPLGLLLIFAIYFITSGAVIKRRLKKTPGDLIYNR